MRLEVWVLQFSDQSWFQTPGDTPDERWLRDPSPGNPTSPIAVIVAGADAGSLMVVVTECVTISAYTSYRFGSDTCVDIIQVAPQKWRLKQ